MRSAQSNYILERDKWPTLTPFEADLSKYLHMTDCRALEKVWAKYWEFCPQCQAKIDNNGHISHRHSSHVRC